MRKFLLVNTLFCIINICAAARPIPEPEAFEDRIVVTQIDNIVRISIKTYSSPSKYELDQVDFEGENGDRQTIYSYNSKGSKVFVEGEFLIIEIEINEIEFPNYTVSGVMLKKKRGHYEVYRNFKLDDTG
jgi:hypothetical protein